MKTRTASVHVFRLALLLAGLASARGDGRHVANVESLVAQPAEDAADGSVGEALPAVAAERKRRNHYTREYRNGATCWALTSDGYATCIHEFGAGWTWYAHYGNGCVFTHSVKCFKDVPIAHPVCNEAAEALSGSGDSGYRGCQTRTRSGALCQRWDSQSPNTHSRTHENHLTSGLTDNYCRNPDGESTIWCYTVDGPRFELCNPLPAPTPPPTTRPPTSPPTGCSSHDDCLSSAYCDTNRNCFLCSGCISQGGRYDDALSGLDSCSRRCPAPPTRPPTRPPTTRPPTSLSFPPSTSPSTSPTASPAFTFHATTFKFTSVPYAELWEIEKRLMADAVTDKVCELKPAQCADIETGYVKQSDAPNVTRRQMRSVNQAAGTDAVIVYKKTAVVQPDAIALISVEITLGGTAVVADSEEGTTETITASNYQAPSMSPSTSMPTEIDETGPGSRSSSTRSTTTSKPTVGSSSTDDSADPTVVVGVVVGALVALVAFLRSFRKALSGSSSGKTRERTVSHAMIRHADRRSVTSVGSGASPDRASDDVTYKADADMTGNMPRQLSAVSVTSAGAGSPDGGAIRRQLSVV